MREITLEELLEAGCHFGHQVTRQNPKARDYIFEARDNIHIIDLAKTKEGLEEAAAFVKDLASKGGSMIVVGPKRQARPIIEEQYKKVQAGGAADGLFFVTSRWIGGILTNFSEVAKNFKKLKDLTDRLQDEEEKAKFTKREVGQWAKEKTKLEGFYGGIVAMDKQPDALFVIDTHLEDLAVREAMKMGVTVVGITDTNADPTMVDYPIPANDDAVGSIALIVSYIIDAWIEGKKAPLRQDSEGQEEGKETHSASSGQAEEKPKAKRSRKPKTEIEK